MQNSALSLIAGFLAMLFVGSSYFFTQKKKYLFFQATGIVFLIASYFFDGAYFAMIGLGVALIRTLVYFAYERKGKITPVWVAVAFSLLTVLAYFAVNWWILNRIKAIDLLCVASLVGYALVLRMPDLKKVRYLVLLPISLSIVYNAFSGSAVFVTISYSFELVTSILAIFKYQILTKQQTEVTNEKN